MNPIALIFGLIMLALSVFFVARPFQTPAQSKPARRGQVQKNVPKIASEKQRKAVLLALRDLDFDYQTGKVAEEDYQPLRASLIREAAELMQKQERQNEDSIEALIQARRQSRSSVQPGMTEQQCLHCQAPLPEGARFCARCGTPVNKNRCLQCQKELHPGDRFCPSCGASAGGEVEPGKAAS